MKGKQTRPIQRRTLSPAATVASFRSKYSMSRELIMSRVTMAGREGLTEVSGDSHVTSPRTPAEPRL